MISQKTRLGLKLWSNNSEYTRQAESEYSRGTFDYIEMYIVPQTYAGYIETWQSLKIPFIIHCTHSIHGFNLARKESAQTNAQIFSDVRKFADKLKAEYIIIHPGIEGDIQESMRQISSLRETRLLVENKPYFSMKGELCRGSTIEELRMIKDSCNTGFCLDISHAFNAALHLGKDRIGYAKEMLSLSPAIIHVCDGKFSSRHDAHLNIGDGEFDFSAIGEIILTSKVSGVTLETPKKHDGLADFVSDVNKMRKVIHGG